MHKNDKNTISTQHYNNFLIISDKCTNDKQISVETIRSVCLISGTLKPKDWEMNFMGKVKSRQMERLLFSI